jgi:galactosamine-6-phosphate isomerase
MKADIDLLLAGDYETLGRRAADLITRAVRSNPSLLLCAATGSSPTRAYEFLVEDARREPDVFSRLRVIKLDEWGGLAMDDPGTCETYLRRRLLEPLAISADRYVAFDSEATDAQRECERIRAELAEHGPIDLCVLGLGLNGHLGFNEPADAPTPGPHVARLSESSLRHPMIRHARGRVTHGLTLGMRDILGSRRVLLLVNGEHKRGALERLLSAEVSPSFPASYLWEHGAVTCVCDAAAWPGTGALPVTAARARRTVNPEQRP